MKSVINLLSTTNGRVVGILFSLGKEDTFESRAQTTGEIGASLARRGANCGPVHLLTTDSEESKPAGFISNPSEEELDIVLDAIEESGVDDGTIIVFENQQAYKFDQNADNVDALGAAYGAGGLSAMREVRHFRAGYFDAESDIFFMFEKVHGTPAERTAFYEAEAAKQEIQDDTAEEA